ncbi:MAG TPA: thymidine phosphorylase family protein [Terriglobales bacterium]|nr:thymidine phosphorylase family protein [Terriglobales bacterium]
MLKLRRIAIDTYRENVAYLARSCPLYRVEKFQGLEKIQITCRERTIVAVLNIVDDPRFLARDELGLSEQGFRQLGLPEGTEVDVSQAPPPPSHEAVRAKILGATLRDSDFDAIIGDLTANRYSKMEIAAFLVASAGSLSTDEVLDLTKAMAAAGTLLHWRTRPVVDKHCIGGVPGNRTSMIVVPIVAAHGLVMPKTSSRAITSPAGTADTMEVLARVAVDVQEMQAIVGAVNGCIVWGGHVNLAPADDILISVERPLGIDTPEQLVASIMAKKLAAGSTHLIIDIPIGPSAKVRSQSSAIPLRKLFEQIGGRLGIELEVLISDGSQPIGRGIGPVLEARDVLEVLNCDPKAPRDLRERALALAARVLEYDPQLRGGRGYARAKELLDSGAAAEQMKRIIAAQGENSSPPLGRMNLDVLSDTDGIVVNIDCYRIARLAGLAGAPIEKGAGIDLFKKVGDPVQAGEPLYRIYAGHQNDLEFAVRAANMDAGYSLGSLIRAEGLPGNHR